MKHICNSTGKPICGTIVKGAVDASWTAHGCQPFVLLRKDLRIEVLGNTDCKRCLRNPYR